MKYFITFILIFNFIPTSKASEKQDIKTLIPATMANLKGHENLYRYGWSFVSSSTETLEYIKQKMKESSKALKQIPNELKKDSSEMINKISEDTKKALEFSKGWHKEGKKNVKIIEDQGVEVSKDLYQYSSSKFLKAYETFITGHLTLSKRTKEDRDKLRSLPGNYFKNIKSDFSNLKELIKPFKKRFSSKVDRSWGESFKKAQDEFDKEYKKSGQKSNTLLALPNVIWGYLKAFYYGVISPTKNTAKFVAKKSAKYVLKAITYPTAFVFIWGKETLRASGLALYYTSKSAFKVVSPTIEAGFYSILGLTTLAAPPLTYLASKGAGLIGQAAVLVSTPIMGLGHGVGNNTVNTIEGISLLSYDMAKGVGEVFLNTSLSGIKLGYNAIVAIPTHLALGAVNLAYFLSWDGPRLILHSVKGDNISKLPSGVVVDLAKLKKSKDFEVKEIELDKEVKKKIIENFPSDLLEAK